MAPIKSTHRIVHARKNYHDQTSGTTRDSNAESHLEQHLDRQVKSVVDKERTVESLNNQFARKQPLSTNSASTSERAPSKNHEERWDRNYEMLAEFKKKNGHCRVKQRSGILGCWVDRQRKSYKKATLSENRIKKLNDIGFEWHVPAPCWDDRYLRLVEFKKKNGHCRVDKKDTFLGSWVRTQRKSYKRGRLSEDRKQKLNHIGFDWFLQESSWRDNYLRLVEFKKKNGHCRVKHGTPLLFNWVGNQRSRYKKNSLSEDRVKKLNDIGFEWNKRQTGPLKKPCTPITPTPQDVTSQPFMGICDDNSDSNICEEFEEIYTYSNENSEYWV